MFEERLVLLSKLKKSKSDQERLIEIDDVISSLPSHEDQKINELIKKATELLSGKIK